MNHNVGQICPLEQCVFYVSVNNKQGVGLPKTGWKADRLKCIRQRDDLLETHVIGAILYSHSWAFLPAYIQALNNPLIQAQVKKT